MRESSRNRQIKGVCTRVNRDWPDGAPCNVPADVVELHIHMHAGLINKAGPSGGQPSQT